MVKHGKRYNNATSQIVEDTDYEPEDAVALVKSLATAKFDETIELHLRTGADPRHADQTIRGVAILPHGVGKPIRTLVFTQGEAMGLAEEAGADYVGNDDYIKQIEDGWLEFDVSIATPDMMGKIGRLGRILGRKGRCPTLALAPLCNPRTLPKPWKIPKKVASSTDWTAPA